MAKLSKNELMKKYVDAISDENLSIEFMEDVTDSLEDSSEEIDALKAELDSLKLEMENKVADLETLKAKYKERFLSSDVIDEIKEEINEEEIYEEKEDKEEVIDVTEI